MPANRKTAARGKKNAPLPPATVAQTLAPGAPLSQRSFYLPQTAVKKSAGRAAFAKGIERLAAASVFVGRHRRYGRGDEHPAFCWTVSALGLAARLDFAVLRSLACQVGALPEGAWVEESTKRIHRTMRDRFFKTESPFRHLWTDILLAGSETPVDKKRHLYVHAQSSAGRRGWSARSICELMYSEEIWPAERGERVARELTARGWGPVLVTVFAPGAPEERLISTSYSTSTREFVFEKLREQSVGAATAYWEAQTLGDIVREAQSDASLAGGPPVAATPPARQPPRL